MENNFASDSTNNHDMPEAPKPDISSPAPQQGPANPAPEPAVSAWNMPEAAGTEPKMPESQPASAAVEQIQVNSWSAPDVSASPVQLTSPAEFNTPPPANDVTPMAVVQVLSTRGVEYTMMMLCLWLLAGSLIWVLLALVNGAAHYDILTFPVSLMIVCVPIFAWFFLRLKKAELANPALKLDPSKRRLTQFTQVIAFAACLFNLIAFVYLLMSKMAGHAAPSIWKDFVNLAVILVVAGGILAYYWNDEHRGN